MIQLRHKGVIALGAAWLATLIFAYQMGDEHRSATSLHPDHGAPPGESISPGERGTPRPGDYNETRRLGAENRFVTFSQTLGGDELTRILPEIADKMSLEQVQSTLRRLFAEVNAGPNRRIARFELVGRWAQLDPEAAFEHIADLSDPKMRHDLRLKGIKGWAAVEPGQALAYALASDEELQAKSKEAVWNGLAATRDLHAALEFVPTLASEPALGGAWTVANAVEALYHADDLAVTSWVERLDAGPVRDQAITGLVNQWARHDPEAAAEWVEAHADPAELGRMRELIQNLAAQSR